MIFEQINLEWNGVPYTLADDQRIMRTLAAVEEHVTFVELESGAITGKIPLAKVANAYAVVLQHAGCKVSAAEVYEGMWKDMDTAKGVQEALAGLLEMMIPKSVREESIKESAKGDPGNAQPPAKKTGGKSSRKRTKSQPSTGE